MSRIVLTTIGSLGDFHPMVAIALELRDRGHEIVFATTKNYQPRIESLGFEFQSLRPEHITANDSEMIAFLMDIQKGTERVVRYMFGNLRETYTDLVKAAQDADFIVASDIVYAARPVAEQLNIRWAYCVMSPWSFLSAYDPPVIPALPLLASLRVFGPGVNQGIINFAKSVVRSWGGPMHQLRQELGLPPVDNPVADDKFSPYLNLALFSPIFASAQPDWPANAIATGFTFYDGHQEEGLQPELERFLESGEPPIVFTLGSAAVYSSGNFYTESIQAAKQLNRRAVLLIGQNPPPADLPADIIAVDYAPYSKIFPRACAIVHQGGVGTTAQALRSGRPTLVVPYSHDQPDNAARLERLGTSCTISRNRYTAMRAAKELRKLLEDSTYVTKAAEIGRVLQTENGVYAACDAIEKQLRTSSVSK